MKKFKLLSTTLVASTILGTTSAVTSCGCTNNNVDLDKLVNEVIRKTVEEFVEIAKYPRPTYHTEKIRNYLVKKVKELGYEPKLSGENKDPTITTDGLNLYFDVPATPGYENHKKLILQGHMDMVVAGLSEEEAKKTSIEVEYHEDTNSLTSKGNKTSLGADNGIGLGLIFALLQNSQVKHGPIRVIVTYDEERGMVGAKNLTSEEIDADYSICLDGELAKDGYYRSCQGVGGWKYTNTFATNEVTTKTMDICLEGFLGGHSGNEINLGRCNATLFCFMLLDALNDANLQIVSHNYVNSEGKDINPSRNAIPSNSRVKIITTKSQTEIEDAFERLIIKIKKDFPGEDWEKVKCYVNETTNDKVEPITAQDSSNLISLITNKNEDGFITGTYIEDPLTHRPLLSCNLCPLIINYGKLGPGQFSLETYGRAISKEGIDVLMLCLPIQWNTYFNGVGKLAKQGPTYPWEIKEDDFMQKLAHKGYESIGIDPYIRDTNGAVEPACFSYIKPTINQTCMGTYFENVHTVNERCYLTPLMNTIKVLIYIFENLK